MGKHNLNVRISEQERKLLDEYSEQVQRTQSRVVREFIRSLKKKLKKNPDVGDSGKMSGKSLS